MSLGIARSDPNSPYCGSLPAISTVFEHKSYSRIFCGVCIISRAQHGFELSRLARCLGLWLLLYLDLNSLSGAWCGPGWVQGQSGVPSGAKLLRKRSRSSSSFATWRRPRPHCALSKLREERRQLHPRLMRADRAAPQAPTRDSAAPTVAVRAARRDT